MTLPANILPGDEVARHDFPFFGASVVLNRVPSAFLPNGEAYFAAMIDAFETQITAQGPYAKAKVSFDGLVRILDAAQQPKRWWQFWRWQS